MPQTEQQRPRSNPNARDPKNVLGTSLPDTVSAVSWVRPFEYVVVRTDSDRLTHFDDHEQGRTFSTGLYTRHNAIGRIAVLKRQNPNATYEIIPKKNDTYEENNE